MATWSLLHMRSPRNTTTGSGLVRELTQASSMQMSFSLTEPATLTFTMPGNHAQTGALEPLRDDVLVFRDDYPVQRFRVVSRALSKDSGVLQAQFSCVSYSALLDAMILHESYPRRWTTATEQTAAMYSVFTAAQGTSSAASWLGVVDRRTPTTSVNRVLDREGDNPNQRTDFFDVGAKIRECINTVANMDNGFEWDINPHPTNPYTQLRFNFWALADGGRNQFPGDRSKLILADGSTLASWTHTVTPTDYANVIRFTGTTPTNDNYVAGAADAVAWRPSSKAPVEITPPGSYGRWELDIKSELTSGSVGSAADTALARSLAYKAELSVSLARGRWQGPAQLWLGDRARCIITEPVDGTTSDYIIYVDENVKVAEISVAVDDLGAEDVTMSLNRPASTTRQRVHDIFDRLNRLERR